MKIHHQPLLIRHLVYTLTLRLFPVVLTYYATNFFITLKYFPELYFTGKHLYSNT